MAGIKLLIRFFSENPSENVITALALRPELLLLIGYGRFLSDQERTRLNFFFHKRGLETIVAEPLILRRYREPDAVAKLSELFSKYGSKSIAVDLSGADRIAAMALGEVISGHPEWSFPILDLRISDGTFFPQKQMRELRHLEFPSLKSNELRFLNQIPEREEPVIKRRDLTRSLIRGIQVVSKIVQIRPQYWMNVSRQLQSAFGASSSQSLQMMTDEERLSIPNNAFEDLLSLGLLTEYERKNHIIRIGFESLELRELLFHFDRIDTFRAFLTVASIRNEHDKAAFHDLNLVRYTYITCIYLTTPYVMQIADANTMPADVYQFYEESGSFFGNHIRRIMIASSLSPPESAVQNTIRQIGMEVIPIDTLVQKLEPR